MDMERLEKLFDSKLRPLFSKFDDLNLKVDEVMSSLTFLSGQYGDLNTRVINLEESRKGLKDENTVLQHELVKLKEENKKLASRNTYCIPSIRTNYGKFSLRFQGPKIWNNLEESLKNLTRIVFKHKLKFQLINEY